MEGSTTKTPSTETEGYLCPVGHFCVPGAIVPRPCPPGFIQPNEGMSECEPCPAMYYCPEFGMTAGTICEIGYYCEGTSGQTDMGYSLAEPSFIQRKPTPCEVGTHGDPDQDNTLADASHMPFSA